MKDRIIKEETVFNKFFKVIDAEVEYESFHSNQIIKVNRLALERGDAVAVLLYESDTDSFLFTQQYRYPAKRREQPWCLELPAGAIDQDEKAITAAIREVKEEIGYIVADLKLVHTYFPSPGVSSEQITIFYGTVNSADQINPAGGVKSEDEDINLIKMKKQKVYEYLKSGKFNNSITIIALQWYFLEHNL